MTHRDPVKVIGSVASLHTMLHEERCLPGSIDRKEVGPRHLAIWTEAMRRGLAARAEIGEERFVDVLNDDVVKRPIETFERVYARLGMPLTPDLRSRLEAYNSRNAPGSFGKHSYSAEEYGLTDAAIRAAFAGYIERFGYDAAVRPPKLATHVQLSREGGAPINSASITSEGPV
jgi:hypothetical protein